MTKKGIWSGYKSIKNAAQQKITSLKEAIDGTTQASGKYGDLFRTGEPFELGARHPISIVKNKIVEIFSRIGFNVSEGPEIEDDWHNFSALNLPEYHPARDMQDTFYSDKSGYLITNTYIFGTSTLYGKQQTANSYNFTRKSVSK